jgi:hypothetical protein
MPWTGFAGRVAVVEDDAIVVSRILVRAIPVIGPDRRFGIARHREDAGAKAVEIHWGPESVRCSMGPDCLAINAKCCASR